jgi:hypothetical protein
LLKSKDLKNDTCWKCNKPVKEKLSLFQIKALENQRDYDKTKDDIEILKENKYGFPALETISAIIKFTAWFGFIVLIIIGFMISGNQIQDSVFILSFVLGLVSLVILIAIAEIIKLFINIAKDLRTVKESILKDD